GAWSLGSPAPRTAGAAAGAAPAARSRQQYGWTKPKLRSTRVRAPRLPLEVRTFARNGAIPKMPCREDLLRGAEAPAWNRAERSGRPTLSRYAYMPLQAGCQGCV